MCAKSIKNKCKVKKKISAEKWKKEYQQNKKLIVFYISKLLYYPLI